MVLDLKGVPNILFDNSRVEDIGIAGTGGNITTAATDLFSNQYTCTTSYALVTTMTVTHESKTGRVLVIFSCTTDPGVGEAVYAKLQKDGVDVPGTANMTAYLSGNNAESGSIPMTIHYVETNAEKNTWRIMAKRSNVTPDDCFISDRILSVIDI